jgi:N6-L-threonylcarbamoyladenine synthase
MHLAHTDRVFCASQAGIDHLRGRHPGHAALFELARLGTNDHGMAPAPTGEGPLHVVSCANLVPLKRVGLLVEALAQVRTPVRWTHFGDGPEREALEAAIAGLPPHVEARLMGNVANTALLAWYRAHPVDRFVHLSASEGGVPVALQEAASFGIPLLAVDHVQAHVLAHFIRDGADRPVPEFPFINLTVSGGHTRLVRVDGPLSMHVLGTTLDDAAGEAFDKGAKLLGLPYPGGPLVDRHAATGAPRRFPLPRPRVPGHDMSFSGIKSAFRNLVARGQADDPRFVENNLADLCASLQHTLVKALLDKLASLTREQGLTRIALSGGVSANSALRSGAEVLAERQGWELFVPPPAYCTDNAAMIAMAGHYLLEAGTLAPLDMTPLARMP